MKQIMTIVLLATSLIACNEKSAANNVESRAVAVAVDKSDDTEGAKLHIEKCAGCHIVKHDAAFYQRENRKMTSYKALQKQVVLCDSQLGLELFEEEAVAIGDYLNNNYYKFNQ